jgi:hypothetical protein
MAMKWIPLDGKKDPEFDTKILVVTTHGEWHQCWLKERKETIAGKEYSFGLEEQDDIKNATHFMVIELPNTKE